MLIEMLLFLSMLGASGAPVADPTPTPEESAAGTVRSIISAEAYHKQKFPSVGYACDIETLVKAEALVAELAGGKVYGGYVFKVSCPKSSSPQPAYRASGTPAKEGAGLTFCADEANVLRSAKGDAAACFAKGTPVK
jgi:hypothetical protein